MGVRFDVIVVGGGPAGLTAAQQLASKGFKVLVIERGKKPGSKNVYGGRIYAHVLDKLYPEYVKEAPVERWVRRERITMMTEDTWTTVDFETMNIEHKSFTAYLTNFVEWLDKKAESAGAIIVSEIPVDSLIIKDGKVVGIRAGNDEVYADVTIVAEGINRLVLERSGLAPKLSPEVVALGAKEVIKLSRETINERFNLDEDEGMAWVAAGFPTHYLPGGAFIYTNKDAITLGVVLYLSYGYQLDTPVHDLVEEFRLHPMVKRVTKGGQLLEYSAHLTPVAGINAAPPKLYGNGYLVAGDAAGFLLHLGIIIRGVDFAMESGRLAAEAIVKAHDLGKYDEEALSVYGKLLEDSFVLKELKTFRNAHKVLIEPSLYSDYVRMINNLLKRYFEVDGTPKKIGSTFLGSKGKLSLIDLAKDAVRLVMNL
ncbi:FAD-dependent oxidoreductase [Vulcanisaeta souniana]|uniref:FAD-dependent oxidoreductase n=1 Tax=Vulcanisaeta souniana JCM 11219 TaxID=1293586 RepID=A0A830EHC1_9CREN|nr:FAD-dependent oxidoreductase [Vulcanisaeta souniana]BDR93373.1 FAD-dependent oxidoreductase [Vulcanisaeta souniana JCM 11219]GGI76663.1 FAD-dependent oxidoreductase [Vulcanisaeta souniana JCM 11219]